MLLFNSISLVFAFDFSGFPYCVPALVRVLSVETPLYRAVRSILPPVEQKGSNPAEVKGTLVTAGVQL